jgi:uncharacterized protein
LTPFDPVLLLSMFGVGLAGGAGHCTTMCGPFVLAQLSNPAGAAVNIAQTNASNARSDSGLGLTRLRRGLLMPYHAGRIFTYALLGAASATLAGTVSDMAGVRRFLAFALLLAALIFLYRAWAGLIGAFAYPSGTLLFLKIPSNIMASLHAVLAIPARALSQRARPFMAGRQAGGALHGFALGMILGLLPCGLVHAALLAALGTGAAAPAFALMAAFGLGTLPSLWLTGLAGMTAGSFAQSRSSIGARVRRFLALCAPVLMALNAALLLRAAWQMAFLTSAG